MNRAELHAEVMSLFAALRDARDRDEDIPREAWARLFDLSRTELEWAEAHIAATRRMLSQLPDASRAFVGELKRSPPRS